MSDKTVQRYVVLTFEGDNVSKSFVVEPNSDNC